MIRTSTPMIRRLSLFVLCAGFCVPTTVHAQLHRYEADIVTKSSPRFRAAFREVIAVAARSTVRVRCDDDEAALGAVVAADGWIVTKASQLKGEIVCQLHDGRELPARIVGVSEPCDLAMLKIEAKKLRPVVWRDSKADAVGSWVAIPSVAIDPVAVGVVSVAARKVTGVELARRSGSGGFLGIRIRAVKNGVQIVQVIARGAASKAGFEDDDIIVAVEGKTIADPDSLFKALQKTHSGQEIRVRVKRSEEELELRPRLGKRPASRSDFQNQLGSKLSERRTGFPAILEHDAVLKPTDCGGPLLDLDGKVIGINIARAGRTETYAIPAEAVKKLLDDLKSGKLAPSK